jgi:hypothetical protein
MNTYSRRALLGAGITGAAAIPLAALLTPRTAAAQTERGKAQTQSDPVIDFMYDDAKRMHADIKAHGGRVTGEHLRTIARQQRLMVAHAPDINLDANVRQAMADQIRRVGRERLFDPDFTGHLRAMAQLHTGDTLEFGNPTAKEIDALITEALAVGLTPMLSRVGRTLERYSRQLDIERGAGNNGDRHAIVAAAYVMDQDPLESDGTCPSCGPGGGNPGNTSWVTCEQLRAAAIIADFAATTACALVWIPFYGQVSCALALLQAAALWATVILTGCA